MKSLTELNLKTEEWYNSYYNKNGLDRNDLLSNPEVLFQYLAFEAAIITVLRRAVGLDRETSKIMDVGCGTGSSLARFSQLGFTTCNLYGIDIITERVAQAKNKYPGMNFYCENAADISFPSNNFNLVMESTMFVQLNDESLALSRNDAVEKEPPIGN